MFLQNDGNICLYYFQETEKDQPNKNNNNVN